MTDASKVNEAKGAISKAYSESQASLLKALPNEHKAQVIACFEKMKGETELWVEARSKTVLRIGGKAPKVGKITLILAEMG